MKKEDLKAAIKANFENNEFATAMELNKDLFQEYENVAGKRSLMSLISYYRKKAEEVEATEEVSITPEEAGSMEETLGIPAEEQKEEEPEFHFGCNEERDAVIDPSEIEKLLEGDNKVLSRYCIVREYFKLESDTEYSIRTSMFVKPDGYAYKSFAEAVYALGGKKGKTIRVAGSFWKSNCGLPVGEEITKWTVFKVGDALRQFAFRNNASAITNVSSFIQESRVSCTD